MRRTFFNCRLERTVRLRSDAQRRPVRKMTRCSSTSHAAKAARPSERTGGRPFVTDHGYGTILLVFIAVTLYTIYPIKILFTHPLSPFALTDRSSQANPELLGFSAAGSVRESVLLCAPSGQTLLSCPRQTTNQTVSNRDLPMPTRRTLTATERRRAIGLPQYIPYVARNAS
jgi:hypothetical protein